MAANERTVNDAESILAAAVTSGATNIPVESAVAFPTEGVFRVMIDDEILLVTSVSGDTFTAARGTEGTTPASHVKASQVAAIVTRDSINRFFSERMNSFVPERPPFRLADASDNTLISSDFTLHNNSTLTLTNDTGGAIVLEQPTQGSTTIAKILRSAPTAPYTVTGAFRITSLALDTSDGGVFGPLFRYAPGNETLTWAWRPFEDLDTQNWRVEHHVADTFQAGIGAYRKWETKTSSTQWFKIEDNNTNIKFHTSFDGVHFIECFSEGRTVTLGGAPDQIGISINNIGGLTSFVQLLAWQE